MTGVVAAFAITAALVAEATGGRLAAGPAGAAFNAVSIDSRTIGAGSLFVAIKGERFDGHDYVSQAIARGATGVLASRPVEAGDAVPVVQVSDTLAALQQLAREIRRRSGAKVVAITGSAGKTSTKEITADLLANRYRVFRNRGNLNNHIGLPLSLTELAAGPDIAVVELGMNHAGEIRELISIAEPDVRVWTNVGDAHIGHFGSRDAVADAKAEILESARAGTIAVVNAEDALVLARARAFNGRLVTFGTTSSADVRASAIVDRGVEGTAAHIRTPAAEFDLQVPMPGHGHLMNALAGIAVATEFGVPAGDIIATVGAARPLPRRGSITTLTSGIRIVDDTYNASPAAVQMMLGALSATPGASRRIAMLGQMLELGDRSAELHEECGRAAALAGVGVLVCVGDQNAADLARGAHSAGLSADQVLQFRDSAEASRSVAGLLRPGDLVLVKGSRGTRMDLVADALVAAGRQA